MGETANPTLEDLQKVTTTPLPTAGQGLALGLDGRISAALLSQKFVSLGSFGAASTINIDASLGGIFFVTTTANNVTWAAPTNPTIGQVICVINSQSGYSTPGYTINAVWKVQNTSAAFSSSATGKQGVSMFVYNGTNWIEMFLWTGVAV